MKHVIAALLLVLVLAGCASQSATPQETETPSADAPTEAAPDASAATVSAAELATHNSESDCWVVYNGNVYDITAYLPNHAEGNYTGILPHCGQAEDSFKNAFEEQHGTYKVAVLESEGVLKGTLEVEQIPSLNCIATRETPISGDSIYMPAENPPVVEYERKGATSMAAENQLVVTYKRDQTEEEMTDIHMWLLERCAKKVGQIPDLNTVLYELNPGDDINYVLDYLESRSVYATLNIAVEPAG